MSDQKPDRLSYETAIGYAKRRGEDTLARDLAATDDLDARIKMLRDELTIRLDRRDSGGGLSTDARIAMMVDIVLRGISDSQIIPLVLKSVHIKSNTAYNEAFQLESKKAGVLMAMEAVALLPSLCGLTDRFKQTYTILVAKAFAGCVYAEKTKEVAWFMKSLLELARTLEGIRPMLVKTLQLNRDSINLPHIRVIRGVLRTEMREHPIFTEHHQMYHILRHGWINVVSREALDHLMDVEEITDGECTFSDGAWGDLRRYARKLRNLENAVAEFKKWATTVVPDLKWSPEVRRNVTTMSCDVSYMATRTDANRISTALYNARESRPSSEGVSINYYVVSN